MNYLSVKIYKTRLKKKINLTMLYMAFEILKLAVSLKENQWRKVEYKIRWRSTLYVLDEVSKGKRSVFVCYDAMPATTRNGYVENYGSLTQNFDGHRFYHRFHVLGTCDRVLRVTFERSSVVVHGRRESQRTRGLQRAILL